MDLNDLLCILERVDKPTNWVCSRLRTLFPSLPIVWIGVLDGGLSWVTHHAEGLEIGLDRVRDLVRCDPMSDGRLILPIEGADSWTLFAVSVECLCWQPRPPISQPIRGIAAVILSMGESEVARVAESLRPALELVGCSALLASVLEHYAVWVQQLQNERASLQHSQMEAVAQALEEHEKVLLAEESQRALRELMEARDAAQRAKDRFFANLSHELRTPLHGILSYATFGIKKAETAERSTLLKYFTEIERSGETLLAFLNDLLDLARLESGKMQYDFAWRDPVSSIFRVLEEFQSVSEQRRIRFDVTHTKDGVRLWLDDRRFQQVFRNLISNAVKFSPDGGTIWIAVTVEDGHCAVSVADQGCGIPLQELQCIFDPFVQSSKTRTASGGTGLGLAISKEIIRAHRGNIWAENRPEGGARFWVALPLTASKRRSEAESECDGSRPASSAVAASSRL